MELAATLVWTTHYINLTPMYFNKAEGCYKYDSVVLLLCSSLTDEDLSLKKKQTFIKNNSSVFILSFYTHLRPLEGDIFTAAIQAGTNSVNRTRYWNRTNSRAGYRQRRLTFCSEHKAGVWIQLCLFFCSIKGQFTQN